MEIILRYSQILPFRMSEIEFDFGFALNTNLVEVDPH